MSAQIHPHEISGVLQIVGGIRSDAESLAIRAALEDLPGVYDTEVERDSVRVFFDPELVGEQQFYEAAKLGGFHASDFVL